MAPRVRKRLFDVLRIAICGVALLIVVRGVTLNDRVVLSASGEEVVGVVIDDGDPIVVRLSGEETRTLPRSAVVRDEDGEPLITFGLKSAWRRSDRTLLLLAVVVFFPVGLVQGVRLQWLLRPQNIHLGYWECIKLSFAGNFLNFATPLGSNAGDVFKAYFVTTHTRHKTEAATTIALDRAIGLGTLLACVAAITMFSAPGSRLAQLRTYILVVLLIGVCAVLAYLSPILRKHLVPRRWLSRLPMFEHLQRADQAIYALLRRKGILLAAVLLTVVLQVMAIGAYFIVAVAMALDAHMGNVLEYYAYFYTGALIQSLPGPPQGLGTVELAYRYFLAPFGSPSQIVCVALGARLVVLVCALPGLLVTLTGSYKPYKRPAPGPASDLSPRDGNDPNHDLAAA